MASSWRNIQDDDDDDEEEFRPEVRPRDVAGVTQPRQTRNPPPLNVAPRTRQHLSARGANLSVSSR
jgi:hypothetical protein